MEENKEESSNSTGRSVKNHIFDNVTIKIVDKNYDKESALKNASKKYSCLNPNCGHRINLDRTNIITNKKLPDFIQCSMCEGTMIHDSLRQSLNYYNKQIEQFNQYSRDKYNAAKLLSQERIKIFKMIIANNPECKGVSKQDTPEFEIILDLAPLFMEMDTIEQLESISNEYRRLVPNYKKRIELAKTICGVYRKIYDLIEEGIEYKQVEFVKDFLSYKAKNPSLFPIIEEIGLIDDASYKSGISELTYRWEKAGLLHRSKIKNRVYFSKNTEECHDSLNTQIPS